MVEIDTTETFPHLSKAPIVEAAHLCELRAKTPSRKD